MHEASCKTEVDIEPRRAARTFVVVVHCCYLACILVLVGFVRCVRGAEYSEIQSKCETITNGVVARRQTKHVLQADPLAFVAHARRANIIIIVVVA